MIQAFFQLTSGIFNWGSIYVNSAAAAAATPADVHAEDFTWNAVFAQCATTGQGRMNFQIMLHGHAVTMVAMHMFCAVPH